MRKTFWAIVSISLAVYIATLPSPLNDTFDFIIGGVIPRTNISIGFWSFMGLLILACAGLIRLVRVLRFQMLERTAKQIQKERVAEPRTLTNDLAFDKTRRSVIAAPTLDSVR